MAAKKKVEHESMRCVSCGKDKRIDKNFYVSESKTYPNGRYPVCKLCLKKDIDIDNTDQIQDTLLEMNKPFIHTLWTSTREEANKTGKDTFGLYMKNVSLNFRGYTWKDSEFNSPTPAKKDKEETVEQKQQEPVDEKINELVDEGEDKNREDVLRMLGYDPFENEPPGDKRHLYNKLVDFLDESTLEDSFKLPTVIEIVKSFNQIDKINVAISKQVSNLDVSNAGGIKSLIDSKQKMLKAILDLAKDNGISVNYNNNKSKGSGTLSGIIKQLNEKGFREAEVNIYDIETCAGMKQVADISNRSIIEQLMLNENDYTEMIQDQRDLIKNIQSRLEELEEENRIIKLKIKEYEEVKE